MCPCAHARGWWCALQVCDHENDVVSDNCSKHNGLPVQWNMIKGSSLLHCHDYLAKKKNPNHFD